MHDALTAMMAKLTSKLSHSVQSRRKEIADQVVKLTLDSLDVSISESRRLIAEGKDCEEALTSYCLVRQQLETEGLPDSIGASAQGLILDAGKTGEVFESLTVACAARKKEIRDQLIALAAEDLELMERELWRLGLETSGQEGKTYTEVSFMLGAMRKEMKTEDLDNPNPSGVLGMVLATAKGAAQDEARAKSQGN